MTDVSAITDGDLTIVIRNSEPLGVDAVGDLLKALADDYRTSSGGRLLAIREIRSGSLFIRLWDAARAALEGAEAVVTLVEFSKLLRNALEATRRGRSVSSRANGMKTVRALIKTARQSHSEIEIDYKGPREQISVRLSRADAEQLHLRDGEKRIAARSLSPATLRAPTAKVDDEIEAFARAAARDARLAEPEESDALLALLRVLVQAVLESPGGRERMDEISRRLRSTGDGLAAKFLESLITDLRAGD